MAPKTNELIYDMHSKNPSKRAMNEWVKIFKAAKQDQDKILKKAQQ